MRSSPSPMIDTAFRTDHHSADSYLFDPDIGSPSTDSQDFNNFPTDNIPFVSHSQKPQARPTVQPQYRMNIPNPFNSVLTMPIPGTKLAPEKFRGDFHKVKEFIQHYERLCAQNNVTLDTEKCETLLRYCSKREKQTIKNIPSFTSRSWGRLREDILRLYDADLDTRRYKVKDVRNFSKKQKGKSIHDLAGWKKYCRAFLRIAGSLLSENKISSKEYATYFWQGISRTLRIRLENRILARNPVRDLSEPFEVDEIDTAAAAILQRDRFDRALDDSDSEVDSSADESSSDSSEESSESESEDEREKRRRRMRRKSKNSGSQKHFSSREEKFDIPKKRSTHGPHKEVENLIKQMNLLAQDDPQYGIAYYRALKLDPDVARIVGEPALRRSCQGYANPRAASYQQTIPQQTPAQSIFAPQAPRPMQTAPPRGSGMICYGCGEEGHGMGRCDKILDLLQQGILAKDRMGRIVYQDGSSIRHMGDETFLQAYEREQRLSSHFVMIPDDSDTDSEFGGEDSDSSLGDLYFDPEWSNYSDHEDVFAVHDVGWKSYAAERPEKKIAAKQKMILDGVYPPRLKDLAKGKENRPANPETGRPVRPGKAQGPKPTAIIEPAMKPKKPAEPTPVEVHKPRYDASNDDHIIEDKRLKPINAQKKPDDQLMGDAKSLDKRLPRSSAVSEHVNVLGVLDQVLNAKVELAVGEIIGVSRELSGQLANAIKFKANKQSEPVGLTTVGKKIKTRGLLIKAAMEIDGNTIEAIIDTGSQLNIVNETACKSIIRRPIDYSAKQSMNDANGGEGKLQGIVENVPLDYGSVRTRANLYVGSHVPFDLLLGRPWQRGNLVSIDEMEDGTYLVFKDLETKEPRHKVLVTPDAIVSNNWDFDPSTWYTAEKPISYFVDSGSAAWNEGASDSDGGALIPRSFRRNCLSKGTTEPGNLYLGPSTARSLEILKAWLRKSLIRKLHWMPSQIYEWSDLEGKWIIKDTEFSQLNPPSFTSHTSNTMQIKVGPAAVQHEAELASLFSSPTTARSEAETLLAGLGDLAHFARNQHLRDIVLSSHAGLVVGHCTDESGFKRTDLMLLKMGLITPRAPNEDDPSTDLDVQYGTGLVHFYPNLGGQAPSDWEIPYLFPAPKPAVSHQNNPDVATDLNKSIQVDRLSSVAPEPPSPRTHLLANGEYPSSQDELNSSSGEDEHPLHRCDSFSTHSNPCPNATDTSITLTRLAAAHAPSGSKSSFSPNRSSDSLPSLQYVTDDSDYDSDSDAGSDIQVEKWNQFRMEIQREMEKDRDDRLREWKAYQDRCQAQRELERQQEMVQCLDDLFRKPPSPAEPPVEGRTAFTHVPPAQPPSALSHSAESPVPVVPLSANTDVAYQQVCAHLREQQLRIEAILERHHDERRPLESMPPDRALEYHSQRDAPSALRHEIEDTDTDSEISDFVDEHGIYTEPLLFRPDPIQVYTVHVTPPDANQGNARPPTPYPGVCGPTDDHANGTCKLDRGANGFVHEKGALEVPPLVSDQGCTPAISDSAPFDIQQDKLVRITMSSEPAVQVANGHSLPSPSDTEPIEELMLPPGRRKLPDPPVFLRPNHYQQISDDFMYDERDEMGRRDPNLCFKPHVISLNCDRVFYPFIETNRTGPRTDKSVPIRERTYYPYADLDVHYNIPRVERHIVVDLRNFTLATEQNPVPQGLAAIFSVLAPRNAPHGLVFPGLVWPNSFGPLDLPTVSARTLGERLMGLRKLRESIVTFIARVRELLTPWQLEEAEHPLVVLYTLHGNRLIKKRVNRAMFFRIIHPVFNPLVTSQEAVFLRGACYALHKVQCEAIAAAIDNVLRSPQMDIHMCTELLLRGCLDREDIDEEAFRFLEDYEDMAQGDAYEDNSESEESF